MKTSICIKKSVFVQSIANSNREGILAGPGLKHFTQPSLQVESVVDDHISLQQLNRIPPGRLIKMWIYTRSHDRTHLCLRTNECLHHVPYHACRGDNAWLGVAVL